MTKDEIRRRIWDRLEEARASRFPGAQGRIPNFVGAEAAARRLASLDRWRAARTVKANPDSPQLLVRRLALEAGKTVYMAVPRLRQERCFLELDPRRLAAEPRDAASIRGATRYGRPVRPDEMPAIDLVVAGSVAVRRDGARVGKGGGYSDLEFGLCAELGLVGEWTTISTTVHPLQVVGDEIDLAVHDIPLDLVVTPAEAIECPPVHPRPTGLYWDLLDEETIASIPLLAARRREV